MKWMIKAKNEVIAYFGLYKNGKNEILCVCILTDNQWTSISHF
jgi:hypothetical protein